jgi:hypothetical protein
VDLLNDSGDVILQGTFSVKKIGTAWTGAWTARAVKGTPLSGTWTADLPSFTGKTIEDMQQASAKEAAGSWQTGGRRGHWWLKSLSAPPRHQEPLHP